MSNCCYCFLKLVDRTPRVRHGVPEGYDASDPRGTVNPLGFLVSSQ